MPSDALHRVGEGDPISASQWNELVDCQKGQDSLGPGMFRDGTGTYYRPLLRSRDTSYTQLVRVKNCTAEDWEAFEIVGVLVPNQEFSTPVPYQNRGFQWDKTTVFRAYRLDFSFDDYNDWADYGAYFHGITLGITQESIKADKTGLICIRGITPALCTSFSTSYGYFPSPWAQVYKNSSGRWTLRGGFAGDVRVINCLSEDTTDGMDLYNEYGEVLMLVDLCDVPNRVPTCNPSETVTVPAFSTGKVADTVFSPHATEGSTRYSCWNKEGSGEIAAASPGWPLAPLSFGWAYRITEATPVCVQMHVDPNTYAREHQLSWGPIGGSYHAWPGLPGFEIVGAMPNGTYTVNGEYFAWVRRNLNQPVLVKADGAQRGSNGLTVNGCWCTDGNGSSPSVYDGSSLPLVKALLAIPQGEEFNISPGYLDYWGPADNKIKEVNVQDGQFIRVRAGVAEGAWYAGPEVLDDPVGTVKMWIGDVESIPAGWREYAALQERFPAGIKDDSDWVAEVGDTGGDIEHTHPTGTAAGGGSAEDAGEAANHLPPYSGVIFIERYQ